MSATLIRFPDGREHFAPSRSSNDPILLAIAEHRAALGAVLAAFARVDREDDEDEVTASAQARRMDAEFALFTTAPTTIAGVAALLAYLGTDARDNKEDTILEYAAGWGDDLGEAVRAFPLHLAAALTIIAAG
jgi:hypothetical protein